MVTPRNGAREARANSVKQLCELYNVVIGVALTLGVYNAVAPEKGANVLHSSTHLVNFAAFLALIIPFYHGAVRHLYATYVEETASTRVTSWAVLVDFIVLFGEGCAFVFLAAYAEDPAMFLYGVLGLLATDMVWGLFAYLGVAGSNAQLAEIKWAGINFVTAVVIVIVDVIIVRGLYGWSFATALCLLCLVLLRTAVDYTLSWKFYFPPLS